MALRYNQKHNEVLEVHEIEGEGEGANDYSAEFDVPNDAEHVVVLLETIRGEVDFNAEGAGGENLSASSRVRLFVRRLGQEGQRVAIRLTSKVQSKFRVTVAFFRTAISKALDELPCKTCKLACKILVSAILASVGVPYVDALDTIDMPGVDLPPEAPGMSSTPGPETVSVMASEVSLKEFAADLDGIGQTPIDGRLGSGPIGDLLSSVDSRFLTAIRAAFDAANWFFDATDKIYTKACQQVGCCP